MPYKDPEKQRAWQRRYRENNREKLRGRGRRWAAENPEKVRRWREMHPEKAREAARHWSATNREKKNASAQRWRDKNPEKDRARKRVHRENNRNKYSAYEGRRRALKANAPQGNPTDAAAYYEILREGICEQCGSHGRIEIDHIEPLSKGGEHGWENFAGLCQSCNSSKGDKSMLMHMLDCFYGGSP
jgi:5-methylcytosine-specific restriction endonuclease McrA